MEFVNGSWLEDVLPVFDRFGIENGAVTHILGHILNVGGVDPTKVIFSESTIWRTRSQEWSQNLIRLNLEDSDPHVTIGMDGKKVQMGFNQGGEAVEHLVVNAQGVSGPRSLGIYQVEDSKGKLMTLKYAYCGWIGHDPYPYFSLLSGKTTKDTVDSAVTDSKMKEPAVGVVCDTVSSNKAIKNGKCQIIL